MLDKENTMGDNVGIQVHKALEHKRDCTYGKKLGCLKA